MGQNIAGWDGTRWSHGQGLGRTRQDSHSGHLTSLEHSSDRVLGAGSAPHPGRPCPPAPAASLPPSGGHGDGPHGLMAGPGACVPPGAPSTRASASPAPSPRAAPSPRPSVGSARLAASRSASMWACGRTVSTVAQGQRGGHAGRGNGVIQGRPEGNRGTWSRGEREDLSGMTWGKGDVGDLEGTRGDVGQRGAAWVRS